MTRRSAGFVSKKPHHKSRHGCRMCKAKKVKCDEAQPQCGYCLVRRQRCTYDTSANASAATTSPSPPRSSPTRALPAILRTAIGDLTPLEHELLHHFRASTWLTLAARDDAAVLAVHRETAPGLAVAHPYLLYTMLGLAASHRAAVRGSREMEEAAMEYRGRAYEAFGRALGEVTGANYEAVVITSLYLLRLVPGPGVGWANALSWLDTLLRLNEGTRILAGSRWSGGIEKLAVYPLLCRELRTLPPPPPVVAAQSSLLLLTPPAKLGNTPLHPNPPCTYYIEHSDTSPVFLPPALAALLTSLDSTGRDPSPHRDTLVPIFHVLGPVFLSLYYYHLSQDFFVRIYAFCSFLMPEFILLVKRREPKALVLIAWWYSLAGLTPMGWWLGDSVRRVVEAITHVVNIGDDELAKEALEGSQNIVRLFELEGREAAAKSIFDAWPGVAWDDEPQRAEERKEVLMSALQEIPA